jgi:hypothetical protein
MMLSHKVTFEVLTPQRSAYDWDGYGWGSVFIEFSKRNVTLQYVH